VASPFIAIIDDDQARGRCLVDLMPNLLPFDCIVADVHLPGMIELDLVRTFRNPGGMAPIILITAPTDRQPDDAACSAGAKCFLTKPCDTALLDCVESSPTSLYPTGLTARRGRDDWKRDDVRRRRGQFQPFESFSPA
jgi:CheY-like chemotaxis protein